MNVDLISKSLCFHGQPLQKIWEGERGNNDLTRLGIANPDFSIYTARQKNLTFQDRAKRLKLHQFIARNASTLFDGTLIEDIPSARRKDKSNAYPVVLPPYEAFLSKSVDKSKHLAEVLEVVQPGDIVYGMVLSRTAYGVVIKLLCTGEPICRYLGDIIIKAYVLTQNLVPAHDKKGNVKVFAANDYVCCEVLELSADADRMILGMKGTLTIDAKAPLGLIYAEQLPEYYRVLKANDGATLEELLQKSKAFQNPNCVDLLFQECGLDPNEICSNIPSLKNRFPQQEYANELRQIQASKWAFRSVADGIEHFKVGRHSEAFQCLNKALNIDPRNVEGLVARGALYANSGSFKKAVDDFETALKLNPYHANARKYMGETLVALGRSYEEENRIDEARKAYMDCLNIIPHHEDAKSSLDFLNSKTGQGKQLINANELALPDSFSASSANRKDSDHKKSSKKSSKSKKRRESSSSSSSNESSDSDSNSSESTSSSDSSSSSSDSESSTERSKNKKKHRNRKRSLSPLSKRMALMDEQNPPSAATRYQFNQPFHLASTSAATSSAHDDYDSKVRNFLNISTEDEDYESRVRKLIEDASKHKKERKSIEKSKKDKKKQKKMKKESKKDKRRKEKSKNHSDVGNLDNMELKEALKILKTLPVSNSGGKSIKDDLMECQKYEQIVDLLQKRKENSSAAPVEQKPVPVAYAARSHSQNMYEMENHHYQPPYISKPQSPPPAPPVRKPTTPPPPPPVVERPRLVVPMHIAPAKPPVVLDKFGSFRLASAFEDTSKDLPSTSRKSKSNSPRDRYSRSRSSSRSRSRYRRRSRSPRRSLSRSGRRSRSLRRSVSRRRSRSRSIRRSRSRSLRRSRSRRRSYSRRRSFSRSNRRRFSRSPVRRRSRSAASPDRRWRSSRSRSRSISSRSGSRSPFDDRRGGRRRGAFRGSRGGFGGRGFRGGRGRGGRRGGGGFRGGRRSPFFRGRRGSRDDRDSRPRDDRSSDEDDSSKRRGGGAGRDRDKDKDGGIDGKWTHDKYEKPKPVGDNDEENWDDNPTKSNNAADPSVEEIDKIIDKAQKERKEDILQRDKDLLKKPTPNNLPF